MGLVTVALLTLTPLALRPVRLACLIHAANVHSEPGSNPSKSVVSLGSRTSLPTRSSPNGSRISDWSHRDGLRPGQAPTSCPRDAWLVLPSPPHARPNRDGRGPDASAPRRLPSRVHIPFCYWHDLRSTELSKKPPTPPAGGTLPFRVVTPADSLNSPYSFSRAARVMITVKSPKSTPPIRIHSNFRNQGVAGAPRNSGVAPRGTSIEQVANAPLDRCRRSTPLRLVRARWRRGEGVA
ncbi:MAG: hypothetical protein QOE66_2157 [Chloroflexota bacterium]|nr:hypothetical protein [Chloroflexota bacterium]